MPGPITLAIWCVGLFLELAFVVCSVVRKSFFRYFFLNLYFLLELSTEVLRYLVLANFGQSSDAYRYTYYYTDALLTLALYVTLISLYSRVFGELQFGKHVRLTAVFLLLGTALFTYGVVAQSTDRLATRFAYELSQNLYFVGLVLTYILWGAILKLRETRTRIVQFVLALGIYFSAYAAMYALVNLAYRFALLNNLGPILGCLLPLSWTFTMWRHSEDARLVPAQVLAVQR
jgi:hypothetical protein